MSFDIFLQRFEKGDAPRADAPAVLAVLEPLMELPEGVPAVVVVRSGGDILRLVLNA